ncbi:hypothetical protein CYMTET_27980 [Cymbomonas tetramitiformis]|uniref:Uncharacterized protein n=1 Tax=Cymbomonas tetramitiformis TaxID=36881 RepID=A0AAE0KWE0_9CHLO|nr:hypothetical protein CYMTET_27980 [Cymbomonas tetramitiformis]|eukprot:gene14962-17684_t
MWVPTDDGESAEQKASKTMQRLFTFVSINIVRAQLEGAGNDGGFIPQATGLNGEVESPDFNDLRNCMEDIPLGDGNEWLEEMLQRNPALALRIMDVRSAYCDDFDWAEAEELSRRMIEKGNASLMIKHIRNTSAMDESDINSS